jgi:hypothetical protein
MKQKTSTYICLGFRLIEATLLFLFSSPRAVLSACIDADVSLQAAAYSRTQPAPIQNNMVQSQTTENCFNQSATTSNIQVYSGNGEITQERQRNIYQDTPNNPLSGMGINTPNVSTHIDRPLAIPLPLDLINP